MIRPSDTEIADLVRGLAVADSSDWAVAVAIRAELIEPEVQRRVEEEYQSLVDEHGAEIREAEEEAADWEANHDEQLARANAAEEMLRRISRALHDIPHNPCVLCSRALSLLAEWEET